MKKIAILCISFLILLSVVGCAEPTNKHEETDSMHIEFETGIYHDKNWNETVGTYQNDAIPNQEVALNVAIQVFEGMQKSDIAQKYVPQSVFYDEQDEIWIVSFFNEQSDESDMIEDGGGCSIAIQKSDGKILRIWFGE